MKAKSTFKIGVIGLKQTEIKILNVFFSLHGYREWYFELVSDISEKQKIDIWLVDHNNINEFTDIASKKPNTIHIDIYSSKEECINISEFTFIRPLRMQALVKTLDTIVIQKLKFVPPINDEIVVNDKLLSDISQPKKQNKQWQNFSVLVVDDSPTVRTLMKAFLQGHGFKVDTAATAEKAIQAFTTLYDLIFLDVVLPGSLDGYKLCKMIKARKEYKDIPVIMLTGKDSTLDKVRGKFSGSNAYLTKPVNQAILLKTLNQLLKGRSPICLLSTPSSVRFKQEKKSSHLLKTLQNAGFSGIRDSI